MAQSNKMLTLENVKNYYGKVLKSSKDLKTSACCTAEALPVQALEIIKDIHPEVLDRFYGCGSPLPDELSGLTVLDLGSGSGRDVFLLSKLVGPKGKVIGLDMTDEQLEIARRHQEYHAKKFGYAESNVKFIQGYMEDLEGAGIAANSVDIVVSNCVINLSPDKQRVFSEIFRVLKPGGELYFSDVFSRKRVPENLALDPVILGECLGGALYTEDFRRMLHKVGCSDFRVFAKSVVSLNEGYVKEKIGMIEFLSLTIRAFKVDLEDRCEDYGQVAYYKGTIPLNPHGFKLDDHHNFQTGLPMLVCSNTAAMLEKTRFSKHFRVEGDLKNHYGLFDCSTPTVASSSSGAGPAASGACC